jgi:hypothetical protein
VKPKPALSVKPYVFLPLLLPLIKIRGEKTAAERQQQAER